MEILHTLTLGEVKRQLEYADALQQLGMRLATIGWFVQVCCHVHNQDMPLVGRLIVPKSSLAASCTQRIWNCFGF